ncbi:MAG TPA: hypothetical protein VIJ78_02025 [Pseudolabrys sp.]
MAAAFNLAALPVCALSKALLTEAFLAEGFFVAARFAKVFLTLGTLRERDLRADFFAMISGITESRA